MDVREKLDRELLVNAYLHGSQLYVLKLAGRYFPIIEDRLKANGVPDDLNMYVLQKALWTRMLVICWRRQLLAVYEGYRPKYGLEINDEVDERFNVVKATDAACNYFKEHMASLERGRQRLHLIIAAGRLC